MRMNHFVLCFLLTFELASLPNHDWYIVLSYRMSNRCTLSVVNTARLRGYMGEFDTVNVKAHPM